VSVTALTIAKTRCPDGENVLVKCQNDILVIINISADSVRIYIRDAVQGRSQKSVLGKYKIFVEV